MREREGFDVHLLHTYHLLHLLIFSNVSNFAVFRFDIARPDFPPKDRRTISGIAIKYVKGVLVHFVLSCYLRTTITSFLHIARPIELLGYYGLHHT